MAKFWKGITQRAEDLTFIREFPTIQNASDLTGVQKKKIFECCEANRHSDEIHYATAGGFIWQYAYEK